MAIDKGNQTKIFVCMCLVTVSIFTCLYYSRSELRIKTSNIDSENLSKQNSAQSKYTNDGTSMWQGKTTDWLGRKFDVNNFGNEYVSIKQKQISNTGWFKPANPVTISTGDLEKNEMNEGNLGWSSRNDTKKVFDKFDLSESEKKYFIENNYTPVSVSHFDVTGDGVDETVVTSESLGCGTCVNFYMTIFKKTVKFNGVTREGVIIKTENGDGFYLVDVSYPTRISFSKYSWNGSWFIEIARKETVYMVGFGESVSYFGYNTKISTSGEARFRRVNPDTYKIIDPDNQYSWFWAMPPEKVTSNNVLTAKWYKFVHENSDATFKIIGTRGEDDCDYWGVDHCVENIDIQSIEVLGSNKRMSF